MFFNRETPVGITPEKHIYSFISILVGIPVKSSKKHEKYEN